MSVPDATIPVMPHTSVKCRAKDSPMADVANAGKIHSVLGVLATMGSQQYLRPPNCGPRFAERHATLTPPTAASSGTFQLGGDKPVSRIGFGAMRLTGKGIF